MVKKSERTEKSQIRTFGYTDADLEQASKIGNTPCVDQTIRDQDVVGLAIEVNLPEKIQIRSSDVSRISRRIAAVLAQEILCLELAFEDKPVVKVDVIEEQFPKSRKKRP